jgi:hypothetical protein
MPCSGGLAELIEGVNDFLRRNSSGTKLPDFDTGGKVCDHCRFCRRSTSCEHRRQVRRHSVTSADNVIHFPRRGGDSTDLAIRGHQRHSRFAQSEKKVFYTEAFQRFRQREWVIEIDFRSQRRLQLSTVRLENRGALLGEEVSVLGVDHDRNASLSRAANHW